MCAQISSGRDRLVVEAHRGDSQAYPENSLLAFRKAAATGAPSIELDVHVTRDGSFVVMHDPTVDRTTGGHGAIRELALADLARLECGAWKDEAFRGEPIPTLEQALAVAREGGVRLNVEVKALSVGDEAPRRLARLVSGNTGAGGGGHVVSSFEVASLLAVRAADPDIPLALLGKAPEILPVAVAHGFPWLHAQWQSLTPELAAAARDAGLRIMVWTLDQPELLPQVAALGVEKICTNRPAAMLAALRQWQAAEPN